VYVTTVLLIMLSDINKFVNNVYSSSSEETTTVECSTGMPQWASKVLICAFNTEFSIRSSLFSASKARIRIAFS